MSDEKLIYTYKDAEYLLVPSGFQNVTANVLRHCRQLKLVQTTETGFDGVDYKTAEKDWNTSCKCSWSKCRFCGRIYNWFNHSTAETIVCC